MIEELVQDNARVKEVLRRCFDTATQERAEGIANFIAERMDAHDKHGWMLKSFLKDQRA
jgi:DNA-binding ferritin-like protein